MIETVNPQGVGEASMNLTRRAAGFILVVVVRGGVLSVLCFGDEGGECA